MRPSVAVFFFSAFSAWTKCSSVSEAVGAASYRVLTFYKNFMRNAPSTGKGFPCLNIAVQITLYNTKCCWSKKICRAEKVWNRKIRWKCVVTCRKGLQDLHRLRGKGPFRRQRRWQAHLRSSVFKIFEILQIPHSIRCQTTYSFDLFEIVGHDGWKRERCDQLLLLSR